MIIREPRDDDFAALAAITNHYIATTAIHFAYEPMTEAELREQARGRFPWLVADDDVGGVIGYAKAGTWRARAAYQWTCELGLYVAPDARGRGIGTQLYSALLDACAARGFRSAIAGITLPNPASVALHERLGFASVGVVAEAGFKLGTWHDVAFFQKRLGSVR
ncbi:MAG TPA: GNAT family N-acetyltransferase [Kofleriaceae bacterium]|nr:GNAT family N-acetyltransferase [Kofleriaceae bacterium]